jgi:hypothetical protein
VSQSPPAGLVCGGVAILMMVLAVAGVLPRVMFLVGAAGLVAVAYTLDKRFKPSAAPDPPASAAPTMPPVAAPSEAAPSEAAPSEAAPSEAAPSEAAGPAPATAAPEVAVPGAAPSTAPPSLLPVGDLKLEHARLTRELTDRVDRDEDVRFEKFMRLRRIEEEIERQQGAPPA